MEITTTTTFPTPTPDLQEQGREAFESRFQNLQDYDFTSLDMPSWTRKQQDLLEIVTHYTEKENK
jgi:hypothetical protein